MDKKETGGDFFFLPCAGEEEIAREKRKARELRASQWWKNRRAAGVCHYCKKEFPPRDLTMDHLVPLIRGGKTTRANVVPCCPECNARKKYMLPIEWAEYMDSLEKS